MSDLRETLTQLRLESPHTLLNSGNLIFQSDAPAAVLEVLLESGTEKCLGLKTDCFVRTGEEWKTVLKNNPFPDAAKCDPGRLIVMFLKHSPARGDVNKLRAAIVGRETVEIIGRQAYLIYPDGAGSSKLTNAVIDRHLRTRGTGRNWNTVLKLAAA
jgi:uncharacterized protein (DUF1697 family)